MLQIWFTHKIGLEILNVLILPNSFQCSFIVNTVFCRDDFKDNSTTKTKPRGYFEDRQMGCAMGIWNMLKSDTTTSNRWIRSYSIIS